MKAIVTDWTVVLAGSWNMAIINPDWFAKEIFAVDQIEVELIVEGLEVQFKYLHQNVVVIPGQSKIIIGARTSDGATLESVESVAIKVLQRLPVTPLSAVGINFAYSEANPSGELLTLFECLDDQELASRGWNTKSRTIKRELNVGERTLNYSASLTEFGDVALKFNYHSPVVDSAAAIVAIQKKTTEFEKVSREFVLSAYKLELDETVGAI